VEDQGVFNMPWFATITYGRPSGEWEEFVCAEGTENRQEFQPDLQDAFPEMRAKGIRVTIQGTPGSKIASELAVGSSDTVVIKKRYSAFYGTILDQCLTDLRPDGLILAGINTHACIRMTIIDAYQRDWQVILATDCVDSYDKPHHDISLRYMKDKIAALMTNEDIRKMLARSAQPRG
jgi:isochorismate hydrolase